MQIVSGAEETQGQVSRGCVAVLQCPNYEAMNDVLQFYLHTKINCCWSPLVPDAPLLLWLPEAYSHSISRLQVLLKSSLAQI